MKSLIGPARGLYLVVCEVWGWGRAVCCGTTTPGDGADAGG